MKDLKKVAFRINFETELKELEHRLPVRGEKKKRRKK